MIKTRSIKDVPPEELVRIARINHVWLNAFACIRPSDDFLRDVGRIIIERLEETDLRDEQGISRMTILTVNKS